MPIPCSSSDFAMVNCGTPFKNAEKIVFRKFFQGLGRALAEKYFRRFHRGCEIRLRMHAHGHLVGQGFLQRPQMRRGAVGGMDASISSLDRTEKTFKYFSASSSVTLSQNW